MNSKTNSFKQKNFAQLPLLVTSVICIITIFVVHEFTKDKINLNKQKAKLAIITKTLPLVYDNDVFADNIKIDVPIEINHTGSIGVYRARLKNQPVAISLMPVTTKGYNGRISLIVGISYDGILTGVNVLQHSETEGFGDQIHQNKTDWLQNFNNMTISVFAEKKWTIKKSGNDLDQLSGATITSRSIIDVLHKTLEYYLQNRDKFYENK